jgi:uncharacterized membrane protein YcjF (UPF0283 family)
MNTIPTYLGGITISVLLSLVIVFYLKKPLNELLIDLCGTKARASFWTQITNLSFILVAMLMSIITRPDTGVNVVYQISRQLGWTLFGMIATVVFVSLSISRFVHRVNRLNLLAIQQQMKPQ